MSEVTRIAADKRRQGWLVVHLDGRPELRLPVEAAADVFVGRRLDDTELRALETDAHAADAVVRALRFLAPRPRSRAEVARRLGERGLPGEAIERALDRLAEMGLLDDRAFAEWWVADRREHAPRSVRALRHELTERGVARDVVNASLCGLDDRVLAEQAALARAHRFAGQDRDTFERRLGGHLARRGFGGGEIRHALEAAWRALTG